MTEGAVVEVAVVAILVSNDPSTVVSDTDDTRESFEPVTVIVVVVLIISFRPKRSVLDSINRPGGDLSIPVDGTEGAGQNGSWSGAVLSPKGWCCCEGSHRL